MPSGELRAGVSSPISQRISLAETVAAAGALLLMLPRITALVGAIGLMHENALFVEDLWSFLAVQPRQLTPPSDEPVPATFTTLRVDDLSFSYPNRPEPVLDGVSLEIDREQLAGHVPAGSPGADGQ